MESRSPLRRISGSWASWCSSGECLFVVEKRREGCLRSLTGEYPFHGSSKKIFQQILNGEVDFQALEWEHISSNGRVSGDGLVVSDRSVLPRLELRCQSS